LGTLASVTVLVALVSEVCVDSVQQAASALGLSAAFVGFIIVALVGAAAEVVAALSNRTIRRTAAGFGQLFHRPDADESAILARHGGNDAYCDYDRISSDQHRPFGVVCRRGCDNRVHDFRHDAILATSAGGVSAFAPRIKGIGYQKVGTD
jgi:hypothetical protein